MIRQCPGISGEIGFSYQDHWVIRYENQCATFGCTAQLLVDFKVLQLTSDR